MSLHSDLEQSAASCSHCLPSLSGLPSHQAVRSVESDTLRAAWSVPLPSRSSDEARVAGRRGSRIGLLTQFSGDEIQMIRGAVGPSEEALTGVFLETDESVTPALERPVSIPEFRADLDLRGWLSAGCGWRG